MTLSENRATIGQLIALVRAGKVDTVVGSLGLLGFTAEVHRARLRDMLGTLIEAIALMVLRRTEQLGGDGPFGVDLRREDGSGLDIDAVRPPVRATIRALLAEVNGNRADMWDQLDLVLAGGGQAWAEAVVVALGWAAAGLEWCERNEIAAPGWLPGS